MSSSLPLSRETPSEPFGRPSFRPEDLAWARPSRVRSQTGRNAGGNLGQRDTDAEETGSAAHRATRAGAGLGRPGPLGLSLPSHGTTLDELEHPQTSGQALPISLEAGDRLFMVGANGSGKSALIQHLVSSNPTRKIRRISAHRRTWFESGNIDFTPRHRKSFDEQYLQRERQVDSRWKDHYAQEKQSAVFFDLVAKDNAEARLLRSLLRQVDPQNPDKGFKAAIEVAARSVPLFETAQRITCARDAAGFTRKLRR